MIAYEVLVQTIEHWKAGQRPAAPPEAVEEIESGLMVVDEFETEEGESSDVTAETGDADGYAEEPAADEYAEEPAADAADHGEETPEGEDAQIAVDEAVEGEDAADDDEEVPFDDDDEY